MDTTLREYPLSKVLRDEILQELWKQCQPDLQETLDMCSYFEYYSMQCQRFCLDGGLYLSATTHSDIVNVAVMILRDATRADVRQRLLDRSLDDNQISVDATIGLCSSLLLMADLGTHLNGFSRSNMLPWEDNHTLRQATEQHFVREKRMKPENPAFEKLFTGYGLSVVGGMKIEWTDNLVDHLRLTDDDKILSIFHCTSLLRYHQR
jgi:hypothetical protein